MIQAVIRQSGGANIISIPRTILSALNLNVGSCVNITVQDNQIILTPAKPTLTLEELLANTPKENLQFTDEDKQWLNQQAIGKEIL